MSAPLPAPASTGRAPRRGLMLRGLMAAALSFTGLGAVTLAPAPAQAAASCISPFVPDIFDPTSGDCTYLVVTAGAGNFAVPQGIGDLTMTLNGAQGGSTVSGGTEAAGGRGGSLTGTLPSAGGRALTWFIGSPGNSANVGAEEGGAGDGVARTLTTNAIVRTGDGGGGTFLSVDGTLTGVAGGGGGAGVEGRLILGQMAQVQSTFVGGSGSGGTEAGSGAGPGTLGYGGAGANTAPGAASPHDPRTTLTSSPTAGSGPATGASAGTFGQGGDGGVSTWSLVNSIYLGGGGGGGYLGGGAGFAGGGGGNGYHSALLTGVTTTSGTVNGSGSILFRYTPALVDPPSASQDVTVTPGNGSATISWEAPASDGGAPITQYEVYKVPSGDPVTAVQLSDFVCEIEDPDDALTCDARALTNGTTYWFTVVAYNSAGEGAYSVPVSTTPTAPPVEAANLSALNVLLNVNVDPGNACGKTIRLADGFTAPAGSFIVSTCDVPTTIDLNGKALTLDSLASAGAGTLSLTSTGGPATLDMTVVNIDESVLEVLPAVTVRATGLDDGDDVYPGVHLEDGTLLVNGGAVEASSVSPLVPAIGGYSFADSRGRFRGDTGTVVVTGGVLKATGAAPTEQVPVAASAIVGADPGGDGQSWDAAIPVLVQGGKLVLDSSDEKTPVLGAGATRANLTFAGTADSPARVELVRGVLPRAAIDKLAGNTSSAFNTLHNEGGAITPAPGERLLLPSFVKVTGLLYSVSFPQVQGQQPLLVAAKSFALGQVALPDPGEFRVSGKVLDKDTDLSTLGGTPDAETGIVRLTATPAPVVVATFAALKDSLDSRKPGNACGRPVQLADDFPATAPDALLAVFCEGTPVTLDLNGQELALPNGLVVYGTGGVSLTSSVDGGTISGRALIEADTTLRVLEGVTLRVSTAVSGAGSNVDVMPGVGFGSVLAQLEVAGGTVVASSADSRGPAIGSIGRLAVDRRLNFRPGSVLVSSGSLTATGAGGGVDGAPAIGGATNGTTGGPATPVTVTGGTLTLDSGDPATAALGAGKGVDPAFTLPSVLLRLGGTEATPANVELVQGTILANRVRTVQGTLRAHNVLDNDGALVPDQVDGTIVFPDNLKVTGHHYAITFPAASGSEQGVSRIVMAKTFALGRATIPSGSFVVNGLDLTADTDLSTLGGTPNAQSGQVVLTARVAPRTATSVEELNDLLDPAQTPNGCADGVRLGDGFFVAPTSVVTSKCVGFVDVDLAGKSLTVRDFKTTAGNTVNVRSTTVGGSMTVDTVDLSAGGTFTLRTGATLTANGRMPFSDPQAPPAYFPGVMFGETPGSFRVEGGTATVKSTSSDGPAFGPYVQDDALSGFPAVGTIRVLGGSLSVSKPSSSGVPLIGGNGFQQNNIDIALEVFGGQVSLDAGSATSAVMDLTRTKTRTSAPITVRSSESGAPGSLTVTRGRVVLADVNQTAPGEDLSVGSGGSFTVGANASLAGTAGTAAGQGEIVNNGTITVPVDNVTVSKVSGNNFLLTFPSGTDPETIRVLAKTLKAGGRTLSGQWKVGETKLTEDTDLSLLTADGMTNQTTGLTSYDVEVGATEIGSLQALETALETCEGTAASPEAFVLTADLPGTLGAPVVEVGCVAELDLNGKSLDLAALDVTGNDLVLRDSAAVKGRLLLDQSLNQSGTPTPGALVFGPGHSLSLQGARVVVPARSSVFASQGGLLELDETSVLDLQGNLLLPDVESQTRFTLENDGTVKVPLSTTPFAKVTFRGNAFVLNLNLKANSTQEPEQAFVLAEKVSDLGSSVKLPVPTAAQTPEDTVFDGWFFQGQGDVLPVEVDETTNLRDLLGAAQGGAVFADLVAKFTPLPAQSWVSSPEPVLGAPKTGEQLSATISPFFQNVGDAPDSISWAWQRRSGQDGEWSDIVGATGDGVTATYTPTVADVGSSLRVVFTGTKDGFAKKRLTYAADGLTGFGLITTVEELEAAMAGCTASTTLTLGADISAPTATPAVGCNLTLDLAGYDLELAQVQLGDDTALTVTDSGRMVEGEQQLGSLVLDASGLEQDSPFLFPSDAGDVPFVTIDAAVQIAGVQVLPAEAVLTVTKDGVLSKVGGEDASITGPEDGEPGTLVNNGRIGSAITISGVGFEGTFTKVTFFLPGGEEVEQLVLGGSLDSVGFDFPDITPLADDEYVRWGTSMGGGTRVLESTVLEGLEGAGDSLALYPTIVKKGTELVSSIEELQAALTATALAGAPRTITLAGDMTTANVIRIPVAPAGAPAVRLDLNGFTLDLETLVVASPGLVVQDSSTSELRTGQLTLNNASLANATLAVASGEVLVSNALGRRASIMSERGSTGSVQVTGGVLRLLEGPEAVEAAEIRPLAGQTHAVSVTGGELQVLGLDTSKASLLVGPSGRVTALTPPAGSGAQAISGSVPVVNQGVILGDLAQVTAPVSGNNAVVTFATAGGELPQGVAGSVRAYAGSLSAAGLAALPVPTRGDVDGQWVFDGWTVLVEGEVVDFTTDSPLPQADALGTTPGAVTITAQWTPGSTTVSSLSELQEALAAGWPIVTVAAGATLDLGDATLDLGSARLVVPATSMVVGGARARIVGAAGAVVENAGAISVAVPVGTGATAYAGSFRGDVFAVTYQGLTGDVSTAQVLGASVGAVGKSLPAGPVVPGKKFLGWSLTEQTGPEGGNPSPAVLAATGRLGTATAVDGPLTAVTLYPVYEDRPAVTEVDSVEALLEALSCANGITAPVKIEVTGDLDLSDVGAVETGCAVELDLTGGSLVIGEALSLGGDLKVAGGELSLGDDLALGVYTLTIGATGKVTGQITSDVTRVVDGDRAGKIVNNGVFTWPKGLGAGDDAVPVEGLHYGFSFTVPGDLLAPEDRTVFAPTVAAAGGTGGTGLGSLPAPARPGFTFLGWNTKADGTGTVVSSLTDLAGVFETSSDGSPVAVQLFALYAAIPVAPTTSPSPTATATPSPTATATPTPTATATATATPTPTGGPVVPVEEEPVLVVDPIGGGGSTGGAPQVGVPVSVSVTVPDVPGAAVAFQWQVVLEDGTVVDIPGATGDAYTPTGEFAGGLLQVRVTTTAPGFSPDVRVVAFPRTAPVRPGVFEQTRVDRKVRGGVQGRPIVGRSVRAVLAKGYVAALPEGTEVSFQWAKGRKPVAGARGESRVLEVTRGMLGRKLRLTVTVSALGYDTYTVAAPKTRIVKPTGWQGKKKPGRSSGGTQ